MPNELARVFGSSKTSPVCSGAVMRSGAIDFCGLLGDIAAWTHERAPPSASTCDGTSLSAHIGNTSEIELLEPPESTAASRSRPWSVLRRNRGPCWGHRQRASAFGRVQGDFCQP